MGQSGSHKLGSPLRGWAPRKDHWAGVLEKWPLQCRGPLGGGEAAAVIQVREGGRLNDGGSNENGEVFSIGS